MMNESEILSAFDQASKRIKILEAGLDVSPFLTEKEIRVLLPQELRKEHEECCNVLGNAHSYAEEHPNSSLYRRLFL